MEAQVRQRISASIELFRLPRYEEIPDVGLYLEQVTKYLADRLAPLAGASITGSMISNYVKKKLISNPVKRQYSREQIAYLIFIAVVKMAVPMEDIRLMVSIQQQTYTPERAYNYFCSEMENVLAYVFGIKGELAEVGVDNSQEKMMLRNTIITVAHKVYLNALFDALRAGAGGE